MKDAGESARPTGATGRPKGENDDTPPGTSGEIGDARVAGLPPTSDAQVAGLPPTFDAYVVERRGDEVVAGIRQLPAEDLPDGDVTIRVDWSAVNYKDGMVTVPGNRVARISPLVPGVDLVGTVLASDSPAIAAGQVVVVHGYGLGISHFGGFAQFARVPASWVVPLPTGLDPRHAAVIGTAGFTAALSVFRLEQHGIRQDTGPVLVTGASGGVGSLAVSLLAARGFDVVASTGKGSEHAYLEALGARTVIGREDLDQRAERVLGPETWAGAIDCVGGATLPSVLRTLRYGGAVAASGLTGGPDLVTTVYPFIVRDVSLIGIDSVSTPADERRAIWSRLAGAWPDAVLDRMAMDEVGLAGLPGALATVLRGGVRGRILVTPWGGDTSSSDDGAPGQPDPGAC